MKKIILSIIILLLVGIIYTERSVSKDSMPVYSNIPAHYYHTYLVPNECLPIKDFYYDRPFVFGSPYLITEDFEEDKQTLIIACEKNNKQDKSRYKILIFSREYSLDPFARYEKYEDCPYQINLFSKAGGLSIVKDSESDGYMDSTFFLLSKNTDKTIIHKGSKIMISSASEGGNADFLCIDGSWYYRVIH